ncbi:DUF6449 domain-containing protein [Cytobacillus sp. IB215316]|uniref:DUF6449 domain-containing protein n=1 Tax=Cytobacillus sp. IB215316 TaxID=3097354 RepID=UPI002A106F00|nr:DUF6449 domain-containing protein [Cytobacillus sp. IB215316]MDX8360518.1 DUF6449 domain-containing protein [Cytobacillus sp. IB215316]
MRSMTSWFKGGIFVQDVRSVLWVGAIYFMLLLLTVPLSIIDFHNELNKGFINQDFDLFSDVQYIIIITVPVVLAILLFRYLQTKRSVDFIHSMPIKRTTIFHHHMIFGAINLVLPVILTACIAVVLRSTLQLDAYISLIDIFSWSGSIVLFTLFIFIISVFVGMFTGLSVAHGILTYIFLLFPYGITVLISMNLGVLLYGFNYEYYLNVGIEKLSPLTSWYNRFFGYSNEPVELFTYTEVTGYVIVMAFIYLFSILIYKKRGSETATQAVTFSILQPVFKYGVTFCTMLVGGVYLWTYQQSFSWTITGYVIGSIIGYCVAEMTLQKTWRIVPINKGYAVFTATMVLLITVINFDIIGFEEKMPNINEIEKVYFDNGIYSYLNDDEDIKRFEYAESNNIVNVYNFHQQLIKDNGKNNNKEVINMHVVYELTNGKKFIRSYDIPIDGTYEVFFKPIYESTEHKKNKENEIFAINAKHIENIKISHGDRFGKEKVIDDTVKLEELLELIREDIIDQSYEDMMDGKGNGGRVTIRLGNNSPLFVNRGRGMERETSFHVNWDFSYEKLVSWLEQNDYMQYATFLPAEISTMKVIELKNDEKKLVKDRSWRDTDNIKALFEGPSRKMLKVSNDQQVLDSLRSYQRLYSYSERNIDVKYIVYFQSIYGDYSFIGSYSDANVPDYIAGYFNNN